MTTDLIPPASLLDLLRPAPGRRRHEPDADAADSLVRRLTLGRMPTARQLLAVHLVRREGLTLEAAARVMRIRMQSVHALLVRAERRLARIGRLLDELIARRRKRSTAAPRPPEPPAVAPDADADD